MGWFRGVGIVNLWENEDLKETLTPPGDFTFEEPNSLETTLTSTGWLMKSLCSDMPLKILSSERLVLHTKFTSRKATTRIPIPFTMSHRLKKLNLLEVFFDIDTPTLWQLNNFDRQILLGE